MLMFDTIVEGTRRCLEFALAAETRKLLFLSSGAVYGPQPPEISHVTEELGTAGRIRFDAASAYAEGKRAAEMLCAMAARNTKLEPKIARCFAFVGPYMKLDAHFAIGNFIRDQMRGSPIRVAGDGTALRSYMYAGELMVWLWTILFRGNAAARLQCRFRAGGQHPRTGRCRCRGFDSHGRGGSSGRRRARAGAALCPVHGAGAA